MALGTAAAELGLLAPALSGLPCDGLRHNCRLAVELPGLNCPRPACDDSLHFTYSEDQLVSDEVEGIRGEYRKPTPDEIGQIVRLLRGQRSIKRASLAIDANVSEKTLERVENGIAVRDTAYKRIAEALGLHGAAFTTAAYIPTIEELTQQAKRDQDEIRKTHNSVTVERLTDPRQMLRLFQTHALIVDDHNVDARDLDAVAAFKDNLRDWSDIASEIPESERLSAARQLLEDARAIETSRYEVRIGVTDRYTMGGSQVQMAVVAFIPTTTPEMPSAVWIPKKLGMAVI